MLRLGKGDLGSELFPPKLLLSILNPIVTQRKKKQEAKDSFLLFLPHWEKVPEERVQINPTSLFLFLRGAGSNLNQSTV